jgi:hypothetical protein
MGNVELAPTPIGHLAVGIDAPLASAAPDNLPDDRSNSSGDNNVAGVGPHDIDRYPVGNGATGYGRALGHLADGSAAPPALANAPTTFLGSDAPLASTTAPGSPADANGLSRGHNAMDEGVNGNVNAPVNNGATGVGMFDCWLQGMQIESDRAPMIG